MASTTKLHRFEEAMESVYGSFVLRKPEEIATWTPPPKPGGHKGRYLWTDAFGVLNFITLSRETGDDKYLQLAERLEETVHNILGRTRDGNSRLPGATDEHPLQGGLRIGKIDASGPDGDGQYHHYLTLWMFALNRLSIATKKPKYNDLAISLAKAIHPKFVLDVDGDLRMVWKITTDMERVLVPSEGHLDAATGYVVYRLLQETAGDGMLENEIKDYRQLTMRDGKLEPSTDTLDLGMALWMCHFYVDEEWAKTLGQKSLANCRKILRETGGLLDRSPRHRLAFREFGTCLGIQCFSNDEYMKSRVDATILFWEEYMKGVTPDDLRPISLVMYAAALIPGAFQKSYHEDAKVSPSYVGPT